MLHLTVFTALGAIISGGYIASLLSDGTPLNPGETLTLLGAAIICGACLAISLPDLFRVARAATFSLPLHPTMKISRIDDPPGSKLDIGKAESCRRKMAELSDYAQALDTAAKLLYRRSQNLMNLDYDLPARIANGVDFNDADECFGEAMRMESAADDVRKRIAIIGEQAARLEAEGQAGAAPA